MACTASLSTFFYIIHTSIFILTVLFNSLTYGMLAKCQQNVANLLLKIFLVSVTLSTTTLTILRCIIYWRMYINTKGYTINCLFLLLTPKWFIFRLISIWCLVFIGVHRSLAIKYPQLNEKLFDSKRLVRCYLVILVMVSISCQVPRIFHHNKIIQRVNSTDEYKLVGKHNTAWYEVENYIVYPMIYGIIPVTILSFCIYTMIHALWTRRQTPKSEDSRLPSLIDSFEKENNEVTKIILALTVIFGITCIFAVPARMVYHLELDLGCIGTNIIRGLRDIGGALNFLVFYMFRTRFRMMFNQLICRRN